MGNEEYSCFRRHIWYSAFFRHIPAQSPHQKEIIGYNMNDLILKYELLYEIFLIRKQIFNFSTLYLTVLISCAIIDTEHKERET